MILLPDGCACGIPFALPADVHQAGFHHALRFAVSRRAESASGQLPFQPVFQQFVDPLERFVAARSLAGTDGSGACTYSARNAPAGTSVSVALQVAGPAAAAVRPVVADLQRVLKLPGAVPGNVGGEVTGRRLGFFGAIGTGGQQKGQPGRQQPHQRGHRVIARKKPDP